MGAALIVVDVQNDFCEGGALAVTGGAAVAAAISAHMSADTADGMRRYAQVVATRDYHVNPGQHFSDAPDFTDSWPAHCVAGTAGAGFHPDLDVAAVSAVFSKGAYSDGYSGFDGTTRDGRTLAEWLRGHDVDAVDLVGIATDHCVRATALDAEALGLRTSVLLNLTAGVAQGTVHDALTQLRRAGITLSGTPNVAG